MSDTIPVIQLVSMSIEELRDKALESITDMSEFHLVEEEIQNQEDPHLLIQMAAGIYSRECIQSMPEDEVAYLLEHRFGFDEASIEDPLKQLTEHSQCQCEQQGLDYGRFGDMDYLNSL